MTPNAEPPGEHAAAQALEKQTHLQAVDILQDLEPDEIERLGQRAPMQWVNPGTVFYSPEQAPEVLFLLKKGRVRLYHLSPEGKALTTALLDEGTIFGEMALLGQRLHQSYAEAETPCLLCLMSREDVKALLLSDPRIASRIAEILGQRLLAAERRLSDFAFKSLSQRLADTLLELAHAPTRPRWLGGSDTLEVRTTHEALAEMIGTHRETTTKLLNEFRSQGLIELRRGKVLILDTEGLRDQSQATRQVAG
jgi:CRP-like cAMP-binding protein